MTSNKSDLILVGPKKPVFLERLAPVFNVHVLNEAKDRDAFFAGIADRVRALAVTYSTRRSTPNSCRGCRSSRSCRASASATTMSTPNGPAPTASS